MPWITDDPDDMMTGKPCPQCVGKGYPAGKVPTFTGYAPCDHCEETGVDLTAEDGLEDYEPLAHLLDATWDDTTPTPDKLPEKPETD